MYPSFTSTYNQQPMFSSYIIDQDTTTIFNQHLQQANNDDNNLFFCSNDHSNIIHKTNINNVAVHDEQFRACNNNNGDGFEYNRKKTTSKRIRRSSSGSSKKKKNDRHSKINTAQGPRDRRMRLSLEVAKKFFKLQDMLGFDKASKTVEWLLMKSQSNIQQLMSLNSGHVSMISESSSTSSKCEQIILSEENMKSSNSSSNRKQNKSTSSSSSRGVRKNSYLLRPLAKETREMARKRARERTVEKLSTSSKTGNNYCVISGAAAAGDDDDQAGVNYCLGPNNWIINQPQEQPVSSHFQFKQAGTNMDIDNWNTSASLFNYQQHMSTGVLQHAAHELQHDQYEFNDFQILGNLWEA